MQEYVSAPERRYPSPSAQRRSGEHWKARVGLGFVIVLTLCSAAVMFRIAGMGVGSAASSLRGPAPAATQRPAGQATPTGGQPQGAVPPASTTAPAAATATTAPPAAAQPTAVRTPTASAGQREHIVAAGDTLSAIATRYNTTVQAIVAANNLPSSSTILNIGQRLVIPA